MTRALTPLFISTLVVVLTSPALADSIERGYVVSIEDREIYINLSEKHGLVEGDLLRIKRPIALAHPVTRKRVTDWLPIGTAQITAVGKTLAMAKLDGKLIAQVAKGDIIEVLVLKDLPMPTPAPPEPDPAPEPESEPLPRIAEDTRAVLDIWQATAGTALEARIGAWEQFLAENPDSPHADAVQSDLAVLRAMREELWPAEVALDAPSARRLLHDPPTRGRPGVALPLAFLVEAPDVAAAWVHYRTIGSSSYNKALLRSDGAHYVRGEIPGPAIVGPGVEYFVEIATPRGEVGAAVGSPDRPLRVDVPLPPLSKAFAEKRRRSRVTLTSTYLDFASLDRRSGDRTDAFYLFEADFLYRLRRSVLYGIRTGFGALSGRGGFADRVYDDAAPAPDAGFNYGYVEVELRGGYNTALSARAVAGVGLDGFGFGVEGRFRLGAEDGTNLSLGAANVEQIGFLTEIRMQWQALENAPLGLAVALTDQPNQGDLGIRLTTDIGYRALSWVQPTLRISYQARTVRHSGVGAGLGLVFDW